MLCDEKIGNYPAIQIHPECSPSNRDKLGQMQPQMQPQIVKVLILVR
jgi:hypothetical protein